MRKHFPSFPHNKILSVLPTTNNSIFDSSENVQYSCYIYSKNPTRLLQSFFCLKSLRQVIFNKSGTWRMVRAWNSIFHLKAYSAEYNDPSTLSIINAYGI